MRITDIISKKRDKIKLNKKEIEFFITEFCNNKIPDYQASALLMAIYINNMDEDEIIYLTDAMINSGEKIDLKNVPGLKIDKHSTGGVGDKITLISAPIVAACNIVVSKMSGKGLGFTGGTIDKLHSIPGFKTTFTINEHICNLNKVGLSISGQSENLVLADKKLYALRDVTSTVDSIPLIASSIMSKKIASGADKIVLDVKVGKGGLVGDLDTAIMLSNIMIKIGESNGCETVAVLTNMYNPLGLNIGNSLEVIEALEVLNGKGPSDVKEIAFYLSATMIHIAKKINFDDCMEIVKETVNSKKALNKMVEFIKNQNGDCNIVSDYNIFKKPLYIHNIKARSFGYIRSVNTDKLGKLSVILGSGRETKDDIIDYSAGIVLKKQVGNKIIEGEVLLELHTDKLYDLEYLEKEVHSIFEINESKPEVCKNILLYIDKNGIREV